MPVILILDTVHPVIPEILERHGFTCDLQPDLSTGDLGNRIGSCVGIILRSRIRIDKAFLERCTSLKFVGRVGAGMENIDLGFAGTLGVQCFNSPEGNRDAVGEHTLGMLLSVINNLNRADRQIRTGSWIREGNRGMEVKGKTVGIIGYGNMGSAFAQRLKGFEARVLSFDKYKTGYSDGNTTETNLEELFEKADIVSLHVPYTPETHHMVNDHFLGSFNKNVVIINTSRGKVVDTKSLVRHLNSGKVTAAALDVLEYEDESFERLSSQMPEEMKYLMAADNVIMTPHIAGWTFESEIKLGRVLAEKIIAAFPSP